jgi:hypothetical protein
VNCLGHIKSKLNGLTVEILFLHLFIIHDSEWYDDAFIWSLSQSGTMKGTVM